MYTFYIIQSLKTSEPNLGEEVYNNVKDNSEAHFFPVTTLEQLSDVFEFILMDLQLNEEIRGVIHFHCHGNKTGIGLYDKEDNVILIKWEDLRKHFREFYIRTTNKPIMSFCSCEGFNVANLVPHFEQCPYDFITGSFKKLKFKESIDGYSFFYKSLIAGETLEKSTIETRAKFPNMEFTCLSAEMLFELAIKSYLEFETTPEKIAPRRKALEDIVIKEFGFISDFQKKYLDFVFTPTGTAEQIDKLKRVFFS